MDRVIRVFTSTENVMRMNREIFGIAPLVESYGVGINESRIYCDKFVGHLIP